MEKDEKTLDSADDVIHGKWLLTARPRMKPVFAGMVFHADEEISVEISRQTPLCWQAIDARLKLSHAVQLDADFSELALFPDSAVATKFAEERKSEYRNHGLEKCSGHCFPDSDFGFFGP